MDRNYPLIRKVRDHILANPNEHNQDSWGVRTHCKTTHCVAGHAVILSGAEPIWERFHDRGGHELAAGMYEGRRRSVGMLAEELLGLTNDEAEHLFFNTDEDGAMRMLNRLLEEE